MYQYELPEDILSETQLEELANFRRAIKGEPKPAAPSYNHARWAILEAKRRGWIQR
jgi:hypothetical protein